LIGLTFQRRVSKNKQDIRFQSILSKKERDLGFLMKVLLMRKEGIGET
jgi:hypothetical protein